MSSNEMETTLEKHEVTSGECCVKNHATSPDVSSSVLKKFSYDHENGPNFLDDGDKAYLILLNVFRFLSTKDLVSAMQVCKVWNLVGSDGVFWKRISLNNCIVCDNDMVVKILNKYQTEILDLRGLRFYKNFSLNEQRNDNIEIIKSLLHPFKVERKWTSFCKVLKEIATLTEVILEDCPSEAITNLAKGLPHLKSLSVCGFLTELDITPLKNMKDLKTLKIDSKNSVQLIFNEPTSKEVEEIKLNLTTLTIIRATNLSCIEHILPSTLVSLELGEYQSLSHDFSKVILPTLVNLNRLRLEKCYEPQLTKMLLENLSKLPNLAELELINFDFHFQFMDRITPCTNLKSLLIIPLYKRNVKHMHALINTIILKFVCSFTKLLKVFVWIISDNFISLSDIHRIKLQNSSQPIRVIGDGNIPIICSDSNVPKIICFSSDSIQSFFTPDVKVKICKIDFRFTWKLSLQNIKMCTNL